jgi:hypothetical protein
MNNFVHKYAFVFLGIIYALVTAIVNVSFNQTIWWVGLIFGCIAYIMGRTMYD